MGGGRNIGTKEEEEQGEDRISRLPDELIHQILSFVDAKFAVQTSQYSTRWKHVWETLPHLNFDRKYFSGMPDFSKFVSQFLSHRNHHSDSISGLNLKFTDEAICKSLVNKISLYAASHNAQKLDISSDASEERACECGRVHLFPLSIFSCPSLQQLCLDSRTLKLSNLLKSTWILPALTTLVLKHVSFGYCRSGRNSKSADLFSNLLNLKNLTLYDCDTYYLEVFNIFSPQLENLVIGSRYCTYRCKFVVSAPKLLSFQYNGDYGILMSTNDLDSLEKVYIHIGGIFGYHTVIGDYEKKQKILQEVIHMFHQLRGARFVVFTLYTIEVISWALDLLQYEPSPFSKMECLKIEGSHYHRYLPIGVITYLSNSSPKSIVINECKEYFQNS